MSQAGTALQHITITRYTTAAGVVVLIYDILLTSGDEVRAAHLDMASTYSLRRLPGPIGLASISHSR